MTRLQAAQNRLEAAVARLEAALTHRQEGDGNADLADQLARVREDYAALKTTADTVAGRLDSAIARMRRLLGEAAE